MNSLDPRAIFAAHNVHRRNLAFALKISTVAVYKWKRVPAERCIDIERITGIKREVLRPDIYPRETP